MFFPSLVKMASRRVLAAGLGFAAGVMIYVSFVEIFFQSVTGFTQQGYSTFAAYGFAVICFFCGVASMVVSKMQDLIGSFLSFLILVLFFSVN